MTFNKRQSKTEYIVIGNYGDEVRTMSTQVEKGLMNMAKEHKMLGAWFAETGEH